MKYHIERCMNLRNYVCEECGMDFNHEEALKNHRKTHTKSAEQARILQKLNNQEWIKTKIWLFSQAQNIFVSS